MTNGDSDQERFDGFIWSIDSKSHMSEEAKKQGEGSERAKQTGKKSPAKDDGAGKKTGK